MSKKLVYLSPMKWDSFSQRPHYFVEWYYEKYKTEIIWIEPQATRLPKLSDIKRIFSFLKKDKIFNAKSNRINVIKSFTIPLDPIIFLQIFNRPIHKKILEKIKNLIGNSEYFLVIGKPSILSLFLLEKLNPIKSIYDQMDNFPFFYKGMSKKYMINNERKIIDKVDKILCSSTGLITKINNYSSKITLVKNGLSNIDFKERKIILNKNYKVFGYIGTIGYWFNWDWIFRLAEIRSSDKIMIVGPMIDKPNRKIPKNISIEDSVDHNYAIELINTFDIGLIPFITNPLTECVDPIKYYEYIASGIPVVSTSFGEMRKRNKKNGVFISYGIFDIEKNIKKAILYKSNKKLIDKFIKENNIYSNFEKANIF